MDIRTLQEEDLNELLDLYSHLNTEDPTISPENLQDIWKRTSSSGIIEYIGLFSERKLVSSCQMVVIPNLTRGGLPYCLIENVVTHSDYQNEGFGKALLSQVIDIAWSKRCYKVMLMSGRKVDAVLNFYRSVGLSSDEKTAFIIRAQGK